uniref:Uncharacterized protein n=1 Tax=Rhizophora mucronata TaxID=61149 RepID=A0A2P2MEJ9_RHIMU
MCTCVLCYWQEAQKGAVNVGKPIASASEEKTLDDEPLVFANKLVPFETNPSNPCP